MFLKGTHSQIVQVFIQYCPKNAYKPSLSRLKQIQQYNSIYLVSLPKSILYNVHIQYCCICSTCGQARFLCGDLDYFWDSVGVKGNEYVTVSSFTSKYISTILNQCKHMKMKLKNVCIQFFTKIRSDPDPETYAVLIINPDPETYAVLIRSGSAMPNLTSICKEKQRSRLGKYAR